MAEKRTLTPARVDDMPLRLGLAPRLRLPDTWARHLGHHGHPQGVSHGWLATGWLADLLSEGDHRNARGQDWADRHPPTRERRLGHPLRRGGAGHDARWGLVRPRLSQTAAWQALEADRWQRTVAGYDIGPRGVRLDRPTPSGDPPPTEEGLRPEGPRKDHRPDRPQGTVRAAAAEPAGPGLAGDVQRGQAADDPLCRPLVARVRQLGGRSGLRDVGDGTRVAWATRADLGAPADADLLAWPWTGATGAPLATWSGAGGDGRHPAALLWDDGG